MNILMTVGTEVFPVASVQWIVVMVAIPVVNCQQVPVGLVKLPAAAGTYQTIKIQRPFPVIFPSQVMLPFLDFPYHVLHRSRCPWPFGHGVGMDPSPFIPVCYLRHTSYLSCRLLVFSDRLFFLYS